MPYQPPYSITPAILTRVAEISEAVGRLSTVTGTAGTINLRRVNRIRTIQGSLAIEGNTLSEAQITAIIDGKRVIAPPREVQEVHNALHAYDAISQWRSTSEKDLLAAHGLLMKGLIDDAGVYRRSGVGVMSGETVIHMAPGANRVPTLMSDLLSWLKHSDAPPLVASSVFHYEFEFIHPFADGNGRMGRLWQTLILSQWKPLFIDIPVESLIYKHQQAYYAALTESTMQTDCAPFIEFMLDMIFDAIHASDQVTDQVTDQVARLLSAIADQALGSHELMQHLKLSHRPTFRKNYLNPSLEQGWIEQTQPNSPRSPTQRYRLTAKGLIWFRQRTSNKSN